MGLELFNTFILLLLVASALLALRLKDLITASVVFGVYSFLMCLLWAEMGAVGVAFTEATVGAGISTVIMVATVFNLKKVFGLMKRLSLITVLPLGFLLLYAALDFPEWGATESPASVSPVSSHFIAKTGVDTEVPNMVTAVLADYRGFDTMFETVVVFIAGLALLAILKSSSSSKRIKREHEVEAEPDLIVTNTVRLIVPVIQIFAFYVLAHGHVSPGGGFQGGVLMGASFILVALSWDLDEALAVFNQPVHDRRGFGDFHLRRHRFAFHVLGR